MGNKFSTFEKNLPRVDGKVFVITGTTSGTGYIAAKTAAQHGGDVFLLNRPSGRAEKSLAKLREEVPGAKFIPVDCWRLKVRLTNRQTNRRQRFDNFVACDTRLKFVFSRQLGLLNR